MADEKFSAPKFKEDLEALGAEKVRSYVATNYYGSVSQKGPIAKEWLRQHDQALSDRLAKRDTTVKTITLASKIIAAVAAAVVAIVTIIGYLL